MSKGVTPIVATALLIGIALSTVATAAVFMQDSFEEIRGIGEDVVNEQEKTSESSLSVQTGFNQGGYIFLELANDGEIALPLNKSDSIMTVYVEGRPIDTWEFLSNKEILGVGGTINMNTSVEFPPLGNSTLVEINGPYETESAINCYNDGGASC